MSTSSSPASSAESTQTPSAKQVTKSAKVSLDSEYAGTSAATTRAQYILSCLTDGVLLIDAEGRIQLVNLACAEMLGVRMGSGDLVLDLIAADTDLHEIVARAVAGDRVTNEDIQFRSATSTGASSREASWLRVDALRLTDESESLLGTLLTLKDVTDLKRAERGIWQAEKMTALGRLAASVAHEVGNPLGAIDIQLQLLQEDVEEAGGELCERANRRINIARAEMRRLNGIVQNFLRFSRPPALHLGALSPNELLRHAYALVEPEAKEREIELLLDLEEEVPSITADENQLSQAVLNILINAFQAAGSRPRVVLSSRMAQAGDAIVLQISDNGHGVAAEDLERIFEFYYTTKEAGTGLGLSIAQRILHQHGGTIEVDSVLGSGTTVSFRLPCETA